MDKQTDGRTHDDNTPWPRGNNYKMEMKTEDCVKYYLNKRRVLFLNLE